MLKFQRQITVYLHMSPCNCFGEKVSSSSVVDVMIGLTNSWSDVHYNSLAIVTFTFDMEGFLTILILNCVFKQPWREMT
jgi:hypothetical protein